MSYTPDCEDCPTPEDCKAKNNCQVTQQIRHGNVWGVPRKSEDSPSDKHAGAIPSDTAVWYAVKDTASYSSVRYKATLHPSIGEQELWIGMQLSHENAERIAADHNNVTALQAALAAEGREVSRLTALLESASSSAERRSADDGGDLPIGVGPAPMPTINELEQALRQEYGGTSSTDALIDVVMPLLRSAPSSAVPLVEKIEELQRAVPPEEWDKLPRSSALRTNIGLEEMARDVEKIARDAGGYNQRLLFEVSDIVRGAASSHERKSDK